MKSIVAASALLFVSIFAFAQTPSRARMECSLVTSTIASTATWRDNDVPLAKSQKNVIDAFLSNSAWDSMTKQDIEKWNKTVADIYNSDVPSDALQKYLQKTYCTQP